MTNIIFCYSYNLQLCATGFAVEVTKLIKAYAFHPAEEGEKQAEVLCDAENYAEAVKLCAQLRSQGKTAVLNLQSGNTGLYAENNCAEGEIYMAGSENTERIK